MECIMDSVQYLKSYKGADGKRVRIGLDFDYADMETRRQLEEAANAFFERANAILARSGIEDA